ncbi:hypothetical protein N7519_008943 [Penicillium mononematosum]|uniref:uncharacterized protein n=1 Tax=Penicillium mononematosum TaxID=268346 RepID=UPI002546CAB4|nr:uncharacterized protein N7519_008943 [Penicillium mononematosum]KAJ6178482.1 hypothetical protein N7519_008943 [Penicillium mononematosum]
MVPPTREQVEARVKKVISKVTGYPVEQIKNTDPVNEYTFPSGTWELKPTEGFKDADDYKAILEGLEKEFNFEYPYSKDPDSDSRLETVQNAIEVCIYLSTIQDPDWRREQALKKH